MIPEEEDDCDMIRTNQPSTHYNQPSSTMNIQCFKCGANHWNIDSPIVHEGGQRQTQPNAT